MGDLQQELSEIVMTNASQLVEVIRVTGDTSNRFRKDSSGKLEWGSGSAAADCVLQRNSAGLMAFTTGGLGITLVNLTAATLTVSPALHNGDIVTVNAAAGTAITLPAATGSGAVYRFFIGTTITSVGTTIKVANASDTMVGFVNTMQDAGNTALQFEAAGTDDTITLNGTTTGGIKGDFIELIDIAVNLWFLEARLSGTGSEATPLSATV